MPDQAVSSPTSICPDGTGLCPKPSPAVVPAHSPPSGPVSKSLLLPHPETDFLRRSCGLLPSLSGRPLSACVTPRRPVLNDPACPLPTPCGLLSSPSPLRLVCASSCPPRARSPPPSTCQPAQGPHAGGRSTATSYILVIQTSSARPSAPK